MHDGLTLEQMGVPAAVICTEPFVTSARAMGRLKGVPGYSFAVIPHPIGSLTPEELRDRARLALPQVIHLLLSKA